MYLQHARVAGPYRVTFAPEAWKEIGRLSSGTFLALQEALDRIAQTTSPTAPDKSAREEFTFTIRALVIQCERDDQTRTIILHRLVHVAEGTGGRSP